METEGLDLGVVTHALGQTWYEVTVEGTESHGGSLMAGRHDALMSAAPLISAVEEIALAAVSPTGEPGRGAVGCVTIYPSSRNITPSRVWFSIDTRHGDPEQLTWMGTELRRRAAALAEQRGLRIEVADFWHAPLTPFAPELAEHLRAAAKQRGYRFKDMPTGIGHDAVYMARRVPTVMLFCPCHGGISHNEKSTSVVVPSALSALAVADIAAHRITASSSPTSPAGKCAITKLKKT